MNIITEDKAGRIKFTFEMDINPSMMQLIKEDVSMMTGLMAQGILEAKKHMLQQKNKHKGQMTWAHGDHGEMGDNHHDTCQE